MGVLTVKRTVIIATALVLVVVVAVVVTVVMVTKSEDSKNSASQRTMRSYRNGAVAADHPTCSKIGVDVLKEQGSEMDAAIAALFCLGLLHPHSTGIGGGGYMLVYHRDKREVKYLDFRETAPAAANRTMFENRTEDSKVGYLSIAVPGELRTMYTIWQTYGKLPWKRLIQPTLDMAINGFEIADHLAYVLVSSREYLIQDPSFRALYYNKDNTSRKQGEIIKDPVSLDMAINGFEIADHLAYVLVSSRKYLIQDPSFRALYYNKDNTSRKQGEIIKDPVFAKTLKEISEDPMSFYNGSLMREMVRDIQEHGGILTEDDFRNFTVEEGRVLEGTVNGDDTLYTTSSTSSGSTLIMMINILRGFKFTPESLAPANLVATWHKIIEAFKFAFAYRPFLGDPRFYPRVAQYEDIQVNSSYADILREMIWSNSTHDPEYYGGFYKNQDDYGTTHLSILGPSGDAVSVTSTLGWYFGAKVRSSRTGIVYNNHMSTFSLPNIPKNYQPKSSEFNSIAPGKRSVSTACPTIIVDNKSGNVTMVVGASGGLRITTGVPTVIMNKLWFGLNLEESVNRSRLHHQLHPNEVTYETKEEFRADKEVLDALKKLGHKEKGKKSFCVVQAIYRDKAGNIYGMSDPRKSGKADGF